MKRLMEINIHPNFLFLTQFHLREDVQCRLHWLTDLKRAEEEILDSFHPVNSIAGEEDRMFATLDLFMWEDYELPYLNQIPKQLYIKEEYPK